MRDFDKYAPVQVAFWLRESERRLWHLYIASEKINEKNFDRAYGEVGRLIGLMTPDPNFDPYRVKVLGADKPLAKAVASKRSLYPGPVPIRLRDIYLGGMSVAEMYIYPLPICVPASQAETSRTR